MRTTPGAIPARLLRSPSTASATVSGTASSVGRSRAGEPPTSRHSGKTGGSTLDGTVGNADRSKSGRALVIDLTPGRRYSVAAESLRAVLSRKRAYAAVIEIAPRPPKPSSAVQQTLAGIA